MRLHWIKDFLLRIFFYLQGKMASDSRNNRLGDVKQELKDLKKDVNLSLAKFKASIVTKFDVTSNRHNAIEEHF